MTKLGNDDLGLLFRAAETDFLYAITPGALNDMRRDVAELHRRGIARKDHDARVYSAMIEIRAFAEARAFAKLHSLATGEAVPDVADAIGRRHGPTTLLVRDGGRKLERKSVGLRNGSIVVIASPLCHFSTRAIRSIESDAALRPLFHDHAVWVVPQDQSTSFATVAAWNRLHPHEAMQFAYRREEWPMIDRWETPVFYFFRGGRVVSTVIGWPVAGRKADIRRSLRLAGLM